MAIAKKETAEQKLLKMIEVADGAPIESARTQKKVHKKQNLIGLIKTINKILFIGVIVAGLFLANEIVAGIRLLGQNPQFDAGQKNVANVAGEENPVPQAQRLSYYLSAVKQRNIFQPFETSATQSVVEVSSKNARIAKKTSGLRLVGVSWLDSIESASVMVEDVDNKVTYFLQKGEKIGDVTVKTIYADSVELGYENEEIIIRYDKSQM